MSTKQHPLAPLKHAVIAKSLEREIRSGRIGKGIQLPGEKVLAERFSVSRNTVRQALAQLGDDGLIATRSGKGSFVSYDGAELDDPEGWAVALERHGIQSSTEILGIKQVVDQELALRFGLEQNSFFSIERVRRLPDGTYISYEHARIPAVEQFSDLTERGLIGGSLTKTLALAGLIPDHGEQWLGSRPINEYEAKVLRRKGGDWFLYSSRLSLNASGQLVEFVESVLDPVHFQLHLRFS
ncbi:GntR family transcriptional regulator [Psychromicrobium silvestre]|uniref:GntR family transcriptional regulator n=1 Tax=Psychromicrobium silvestre TaxID=1645614 RepID=A0A7Y9LUP9_9MICC|nr:GntR family transcriptional regulator [Psychromicrobium silvestre]NYE95967.1 GntR family transcriptional regulator [Psychromicrobium silvestre]